MRNLHRRFDRYYIEQIYGGDLAKICGLLRIYDLYLNNIDKIMLRTNILRRPQQLDFDKMITEVQEL